MLRSRGAIAFKICIGALLHTFDPLLNFDHFQAMQVMQKPMCMRQFWQCSHMFISASVHSFIKSVSSLGVRSGQS